jgi:N-methylhydantoinase B
MLVEEASPGEYRGGTGVVLEFTCLASEAIVTARGMDRFKIRPFGRKGGEPGPLGNCTLDPGTPNERQRGKIEVLRLKCGDTVRIVSPGGGGYGLAIDRDPAGVLGDVRNGLVTEDEAREVYGVVFAGDAVDEAATLALRDQHARPSTPEEFIFGPERLGYERVLTPALQDIVATLLAGRPPELRQYARGLLYDRITLEPELARLPDDELEARLARMLEQMLTMDVAAVA